MRQNNNNTTFPLRFSQRQRQRTTSHANVSPVLSIGRPQSLLQQADQQNCPYTNVRVYIHTYSIYLHAYHRPTKTFQYRRRRHRNRDRFAKRRRRNKRRKEIQKKLNYRKIFMTDPTHY